MLTRSTGRGSCGSGVRAVVSRQILHRPISATRPASAATPVSVRLERVHRLPGTRLRPFALDVEDEPVIGAQHASV